MSKTMNWIDRIVAKFHKKTVAKKFKGKKPAC